MDCNNRSGHVPRLLARIASAIRRYRTVALHHAVRGAAQATGTTAVGLIVFVIRHHL
jgi:hypothetical protein